MSRGNVISIVRIGGGLESVGEIAGAVGAEELAAPIELAGLAADELEGIVVTFQLRSGGTRSYRYSGDAAAAILGGADPAQFSGEPM
jgi:hypothetical protein